MNLKISLIISISIILTVSFEVIHCFYTNIPNIMKVNRYNYDNVTSGVDTSGGIIILNFYDKRQIRCERFATTYRQFSLTVDGVIKLGAINIQESKFLTDYLNVTVTPLLIYYYRQNSYRLTIGNYGYSVAKLIKETYEHVRKYYKQQYNQLIYDKVQWNYNILNITYIKNEMKKSKHPWIIFVYGKYCIICLSYLIEWRNTFENYSNKSYNYGVIDASKYLDIFMELQIYGYPSVIYINETNVFHFNQNFQKSSLLEWIQKITDSNQSMIIKRKQSIKQLCELREYCVISVLPPNEYCTYFKKLDLIRLIHNQMKKFYRSDWNWVWFHMNDTHVDLDYQHLVQELPTMFIINGRHPQHVHGRLEYDFDDQGLNDFLTQMNKKLINENNKTYNWNEVIDFIKPPLLLHPHKNKSPHIKMQ